MKRDAFTLPLAFPGELIIDNFAGGGGTSTGLEAAFGRPVDIAINHDPEALAMHAINHPHTQHLCESVWDVDPIAVTGNQPVGLVWLSPDCKHFSKAKGGTPVAKHIRGLAWVGMRWVAKCKPRVLMLENVEEFQTWGPLLVGADGTARPDPARKGKTFQSFVRQLRDHGYVVDWRELRACDNGAPTIRKRLFLIARRDGLPIIWPEQTHAIPTDRRVLAGKLQPYRTAAECIDFTLPATSIFDRKKPLATNTQRRVAKGLWRHVLATASPYIVNTQEIAHNAIHHDRAAANQNPQCGSGSLHQGPAGSAPHISRAGPQPLHCKPTDSAHAAIHNQRCEGPESSGHPDGASSRAHGTNHGIQSAALDGGPPAAAAIRGDAPAPAGSSVRATELATASRNGQQTVTPFLTEHANASNQRTMAADEPLRTQCAQVKGGHFSLVAPTLAPYNGFAPSGTAVEQLPHGEPSGAVINRSRAGRDLSEMPGITAPSATFSTASLITPLRGTTEAHLGGHDVLAPLSTVAASGTHHGLTGAHLVTIGYGERPGQDARTQAMHSPLGTAVAGGVKQGVVAAHLTHLTHHGERSGHSPAEPLRTITGAHRGEQAMVAAHLVDMGHGEGACGTKRFSHGVRDVRGPLGTCTASNPPSALVTACLEQANGGFYDGDGRPVDAPASTITSSGAQQRLITAYAVKYYSSGGQWQGLGEPMHTLPTKGRMGLVQAVQVSADSLAPEHRAHARQCAELLHTHLPEHFPTLADVVLVWHAGSWWALVDITLRMLKPKELFKAQGFPDGYVIHEIPNPALLFNKDGKQAAHPLQVPRIPLSATAQVRMCGNSVSPPQAEALVRANFGHEAEIYGRAAA